MLNHLKEHWTICLKKNLLAELYDVKKIHKQMQVEKIQTAKIPPETSDSLFKYAFRGNLKKIKFMSSKPSWMLGILI